MMTVQCLCARGYMNVIIPPHPTHPKTLKGNGVATEGKTVSQLRENQGRFGVTSEGLTGQGGSSILGLPELKDAERC